MPVHFTPRGKKPRYPLDRRLDGLQNRSGSSLSPVGIAGLNRKIYYNLLEQKFIAAFPYFFFCG